MGSALLGYPLTACFRPASHTSKKAILQGRATKLGKGLQGTSSEERLRTAWLPGLEAERCLPALCSFVRGDGEGGAGLCSLVTHIRAAPGGSDWTSGKNLLTMKVVKHWNRLPERWLMPCACSRSI